VGKIENEPKTSVASSWFERCIHLGMDVHLEPCVDEETDEVSWLATIEWRASTGNQGVKSWAEGHTAELALERAAKELACNWDTLFCRRRWQHDELEN
jgi:hypothetical protein